MAWRGGSRHCGLSVPAILACREEGGIGDSRHVWPEIARIIAECEPSLVFLENVPGHLSLGLREVVADLQRLCYGVAPPVLVTAEEVGASHRRERLFVLAYREGGGCGELRESSARQAGRAERGGEDVADVGESNIQQASSGGADGSGGGVAARAGLELADPAGARRQKAGPRAGFDSGGESEAGGGGLAVSIGAGLEGCELAVMEESGGRGQDSDSCGSGFPSFPPGPDDRDAWGRVLTVRPDLAPALEPEVRLLADGFPSGLDGDPMRDRADRLKALGNAVVPQQAAFALRLLLSMVEELDGDTD